MVFAFLYQQLLKHLCSMHATSGSRASRGLEGIGLEESKKQEEVEAATPP